MSLPTEQYTAQSPAEASLDDRKFDFERNARLKEIAIRDRELSTNVNNQKIEKFKAQSNLIVQAVSTGDAKSACRT